MAVRTVKYGIPQRNIKSQIPYRLDVSLPLSRQCVANVLLKLVFLAQFLKPDAIIYPNL